MRSASERVPGAARSKWRDSVADLAVFVDGAFRYWFLVYPYTAWELHRLRRDARRISAPAARDVALLALAKRSNIEGAAAFAAFVPLGKRRAVASASIAFQALYNHADLLSEQPSDAASVHAGRMHQVLLAALDVDAGDDSAGGERALSDDPYTDGLVRNCRAALRLLPSYEKVAGGVRVAAERIVAFQTLSQGAESELRSWSSALSPAAAGLEWWERAAAAGSSLSVYALIAAAASPTLEDCHVAAIQATYFPWAGALHSLLDSLIDQVEDARAGDLSLIGCYPSSRHAATAMRTLALSAISRALQLPQGRREALLVTAMACSYLAHPAASQGAARAIALEVQAALGELTRPVLLVFAMRQLPGRIRGPLRGRSSPAGDQLSATFESAQQGADARAV